MEKAFAEVAQWPPRITIELIGEFDSTQQDEKTSVLEIVDENGNVHEVFSTTEEALKYAEDRGLGEQQDADNVQGVGWYFRIPSSQ